MATSRPIAYNPSLVPISGATQVGNLVIATNSTALSNTNGSILLNSSPSQYLSIPNSTGFTQNQAFTIECWFRPTNLQGGYVWAMLQTNFLTVAYRNSGKFVIDMSYVGNPPGYTTLDTTYPINNWYHIALVWNGTTGKLFINGAVEWTFTGAGALVDSGNPLLIGQYQGQGQTTPLGNISNFRIVKGTAVYTSAFTPPTSPLTAISGTQLLLNTYNGVNLLQDSSTNNFTVTNNGSVTSSTLSNFSGITWWNGPDESLGHVIAVPVATNTQPTPINGVSASVGFYRTNGLTDNGFINLAQSVAFRNGTPQVFSTTTDAKTWLNTNGFWTSYTPSLITSVFSSDGSSLTGWTQIDGSVVVDATIGNPSSSFKLTGRGLYRNLGTTFHNKTITFDMRIGSNIDGGFSFANAAGGNGGYRGGLQMKQSAGSIAGQGLRAGSNGGWLYFGVGAPETLTLFTSTTTWYSIKIQITSARVCTWYVNGTLQSSTYTIPVGYTTANTTNNYFGFILNGASSGTYFDNLYIYEGIV